ncbi:hypothetical protein B0H15DRAFT_818687 [Mycena belliarum]|uniref:RRM domain-containing protein n=1 Tax=Mycena belliarum TaxID=1033014 RepID=A0AAD6UDP4_9AGAR|nr:hypothetical protein B0H15DRAFT_818687 [Mycena belliae]
MASFRSNRVVRKPYSRPAPRASADGQWLHDLAPGTPGARARLAVPGSLGAPSIPNSKLVVSNLHYEISPKDLTAIFGQIGTLVCEPQIRYDRSGRSSGTAIVSFETPTEAARAKKQFDGILAKSQPMTIVFDASAPRGRSASAPTTSSLLNRIQKVPLLTRLSKDDTALRAPSAPRGGVGPIRTRGARGAASAPRPAPKKPKTAEELDKELEAFMGDTEAVPPAAVPAQDVEMA